MVPAIKTSISIPKTLRDQAEILAEDLQISRNQLFRMAIEHFIMNYPSQTRADEIDMGDGNEPARSSYQDGNSAAPIGGARLGITQGDLFWVQLGSEPGIRHPHVVIQDNVFNHSRIHTVVACALTSNIERANTPGNVLLEVGEANLPKQSVVEVSKVTTVDKAQLGDYIGSLTEQRIDQIVAGMRFLQRSFFAG